MRAQEKLNHILIEIFHTRKRKYKPYEEISREFKKIKLPTFNAEIKKGEEAELWLSGMKKYFQIYN